MIAGNATLSRVPRWGWFIIIPVAILLALVLILAALPLPADTPLPESEWYVGAVAIEPAWTGLLREWPNKSGSAFDPALANLGAMLFFDPILSGDNSRSCASCHHADWAFSEPNALAPRPDGTGGLRHTPTLWNVAFSSSFFWDGRSHSLEDQALESIASPLELNQNPSQLVTEISIIPEYGNKFLDLFNNGITEQNIAVALAAFERTLISDGSPFDAYAQGNMDALTSQQRRGLTLFRSASTRCFECHMAPTFTDGGFAVIGVPDETLNDRGQGASSSGGVDFAFRTPTLRNVALRGPYMHNGNLSTLKDVINLYASGGKDFTRAAVDHRIAGFSLTDQEKEDLIAFLFALTDETIPEAYWSVNYVDTEGHIVIPAQVPSRLPVIAALSNPSRQLLATLSAAPIDRPDCNRPQGNTTLIVKEGESIQKAIDCAIPGDTITVEPGVYHERIVIDQSNITLRGSTEEPSACPLRTPGGKFPQGVDAPAWPILDGDVDGDGKPDLTDAVISSGNNFTMEYFMIRQYSGNGILVEGVDGVILRHIFTSNTGLYGTYPVHSTNVLIECSVATQIHDAGIYVGQSRDIVVRNSLAYDNVTGIEIENSYNANVYNNETWGNTGGILVFLLPNLRSRISSNTHVHDNVVYDNNRVSEDARPGSVVTLVPAGTGIFLLATDNAEVNHNQIKNNNSFGVAIASLYQAFKPAEIANGVGPLPENIWIHDNTYTHNGTNPAQGVKDAGLPGADVLWDASGSGHRFDETGAKTFPPVLPSTAQPGFIQRAINQLWNLLSKL
jgi:parallel beta-helix repeat protein